MKNIKHTALTTITAIALLGFATISMATDGHQLIGLGAIQKGTAGAGVASGKDATWVLLNPAAIQDLEPRIDVNIEYFAPDRYMEPTGPGLPQLGGASLANSSAGRSSDDDAFYIPSVAIIFPDGEGKWGLGLYAVGGMGVDYDSPRTTVPLMSGESFDSMTEYGVSKLALAYSYPIATDLYVGVQGSLDYARFRTDMATPEFRQTKGNGDWDDSLGAGFQLGILKKFEKLAIGGTYISRQWMESFDQYDDLFIGPLDIPQMVQVGLSYHVIPQVELLLDYKFINWNSVDAIGKDPAQGGFGWDDQNIVKVGVTWDVNDAVTLRTGYSHGNSPIDEEVVFANALFPAVMEDHVTFGASYDLNERSSLHVAYMHAFENILRDSGKGDTYSQAGAGTEISMEEDSVTLQLTHLF